MATGEIRGYIQGIVFHPKMAITLVTWWDAVIKIEFDDDLEDAVHQLISEKYKSEVIVEADNDIFTDLGGPVFRMKSIRSAQ